jgi:hypothetical protein
MGRGPEVPWRSLSASVNNIPQSKLANTADSVETTSKESSQEWRLGSGKGEFVPVGIDGTMTEFEGDHDSIDLPLTRNPRNGLEEGAESSTWKRMF